MLLAVLVRFVELVNKVNKHVVVQISVLTHFSLQNVDPVLEVLKREVVFKADTAVRHRFPNLLALLQISAYLLSMYETYYRTQEVFHAYGSIFVWLHIEELVVPQVMAKFLSEVPNINEGDCLLVFKQNFEHRVCTLVKFFITDGHAAGVKCHGPSVMGAGCALLKDLVNSFF